MVSKLSTLGMGSDVDTYSFRDVIGNPLQWENKSFGGLVEKILTWFCALMKQTKKLTSDNYFTIYNAFQYVLLSLL